MVLVGTGTLVTSGLLGVVSWSALRSSEAALRQSHQALASLAAREMDERLEAALSALQRLANDARSSEPLQEPRPELDALTLETWQQARLDRLLVATLDGTVWAHAPTSQDPDSSMVAKALQRMTQTPRPWVFAEFDSTRPAPRVGVFVPLWSWRGELLGAVGGDVDPGGRHFSAWLGAFANVAAGRLDVVDGEQRVIFSTAPDAPADGAAPTAPLATAPWRVVVHSTDGAAPASRFWSHVLWLAPLLIAGTLLLAWGTAWSVRRPLSRLTRAAMRLAEGDLATPVRVGAADEVGQLAVAFESMRQALEASQRELQGANAALELRVQARTSELEQANRQLREREHARQVLLGKVITAQEDERKRIAREVHDEACQTVTALGLRLDSLLASPEVERSELTRARALASRCLDELHRLMRALRPPLLDDLGLVAALRQYAGTLANSGLAVRFESAVVEVSLSPEVQIAVFRAAQEALNNVLRHAQAEMVLVEVAVEHGTLAIDVEDDGVGFDPESLPPSMDRGRGLGFLYLRLSIGRSLTCRPGCPGPPWL